jgi:hypothetical protein
MAIKSLRFLLKIHTVVSFIKSTADLTGRRALQGCPMVFYCRYVGIFSGSLVYFPQFWYLVPRKSGNPGALVLRVEPGQHLRDLLLHVHHLAVVLGPPPQPDPLLQVPQPTAHLGVLAVSVSGAGKSNRLGNKQDQRVGQQTGSTSWSTKKINKSVNQDQLVGQPTGSTGWSTNRINWLVNQQDQLFGQPA